MMDDGIINDDSNNSRTVARDLRDHQPLSALVELVQYKSIEGGRKAVISLHVLSAKCRP